MITLGVEDLQRSISFYQNGLKFPRMDSPPTVAFFTLSGSWLGLYGRKELAEDANVSSLGNNGFPGFAIAHNVNSKSEVNQLLDQALAAGAIITKPAQEVFWGGYSGYFKDPDGYLWEIAYNPHFWVGPPEVEAE